MGTRVTIKGQVTIPKDVRDAAGIGPGDEIEFVLDATGRVTLVHANRQKRVRAALERIRRDPPITGTTTEQIMQLTRGDEG